MLDNKKQYRLSIVRTHAYTWYTVEELKPLSSGRLMYQTIKQFNSLQKARDFLGGLEGELKDWILGEDEKDFIHLSDKFS